jgi:hypothetical protein
MRSFIVWVVSPQNYPHSAVFHDTAESIAQALFELGHDSKVVKSPEPTEQFIGHEVIVLGANVLPLDAEGNSPLPQDCIVFNLEQVSPGSEWMTQNYITILRQARAVWDYSEQNILALKNLGISAKYCGIGYNSTMEKVQQLPLNEKDIEVLFYGSMNARRQKIIDDLLFAGVKVKTTFGVYGKNLDKLIARSKIVLNMHFYDSKVFEIIRCAYAMANKCAIVSEDGPDKELQQPYLEGILFAPYDQLVASCIMMLRNESERTRIATNGHVIFKSRKQSEFLKALVGEHREV